MPNEELTDPQGVNKPANSAQPKPSRWLAFAEGASKIAVAFSIALYGLGFLIAVPHFSKYGVSLHELAPATYLAAGLSFMIFSATIFVMGRWISDAIGRRGEPLLGRAARVFGTLIFPGWFLWQTFLAGSSRALLYAALFSIFTGLFYFQNIRDVRALIADDDWSHDPKNYVHIAVQYFILTTALLGVYGGGIYAHVPREFGGAAPILVTQVSIHDCPGADGTCGAWERFRCHRSLTRTQSVQSVCLHLYQAFESETHAFFVVQESLGECPLKRKQVPGWLGAFVKAEPKGTCAVRISQSDLPLLELAAEYNGGAFVGPD